jgi:OmpA-OmpF porin, OOP family
MSANLLDSLKGYLTPELITQASGMLGESENGITKAVSAAIPSLLNGLLNKSNDSGVMGSVMDLVSKQSAGSEGVLTNLSGLLSGDSASSSLSTSLLGSLFGNKVSGITDLIAGVSGVKSSSVTSLLGMAAPMLLSHLGKLGLSVSGLTSLLSSEKESILSAAPAGLASAAGFTNNFSSHVKTSTNTIDHNEPGGGFPKWLFPVLLIGIALIGLYYFTKGCNKPKSELENEIEVIDSSGLKAIDTVVGKSKVMVKDTVVGLGDFFKFKLPNGVELNAPEKGIENQVVTWMGDKAKMVDKTTWFNFDRLLFETGKSTLKPESQEQLKNMSEIMKAFPTMEIKLGGYTDNTGVAASNLKLSGDRAKSVMAELVKMGITTSRVTAEGYGDQFPVASNDTEEGKAQNRRIAVRITKK